MPKAADALIAVGKGGLELVKAAGKAAGKGVKTGAEEAVKEAAHNATKVYLRGRLGYHGPRASAGPLDSVFVAPATMSFAPSARAPAQLYPTFCDCEENPVAEAGPHGKLLKCHSCAPRGMPAREYRGQLDVASVIAELVERPRPSYKPRARSSSEGRKQLGVAASLFKLYGLGPTRKQLESINSPAAAAKRSSSRTPGGTKKASRSRTPGGTKKGSGSRTPGGTKKNKP
jgi:hypothetical protein